MTLKRLRFVRAIWAVPLLLAAAGPACAKEAPASAKQVASAKKTLVTPVQNYVPRPAIWLLEDADTKIYLFGTNHILPAGFKWRSPAFEKTVAAADELVVETYTTPEQDAELEAEVMPLMLLEKPRPFVARFPKAHHAAIREGIEASGLADEALDIMQTWAGGMMIGLAAVFDEYGAEDPDDVPGVEDLLEAEFKTAGKPILSIEEPIGVLRSLSELPERVQIEMMIGGMEDDAALEAATDASEDEAVKYADIHAWAQGRPSKLAEDLKDMPPELYEVLLTRRNTAWAEWLAKRLDRPGTVLLAVGAGHLTGRDSVQTMLARRGLQAKRFD